MILQLVLARIPGDEFLGEWVVRRNTQTDVYNIVQKGTQVRIQCSECEEEHQEVVLLPSTNTTYDKNQGFHFAKPPPH